MLHSLGALEKVTAKQHISVPAVVQRPGGRRGDLGRAVSVRPASVPPAGVVGFQETSLPGAV